MHTTLHHRGWFQNEPLEGFSEFEYEKDTPGIVSIENPNSARYGARGVKRTWEAAAAQDAEVVYVGSRPMKHLRDKQIL